MKRKPPAGTPSRAATAAAVAAPAPSPAPPGRVFMEGQIVRLTSGGRPVVKLRSGREIAARLASTIDPTWLEAALAVGPVDAEGTLDLASGSGSVWCVFPGREHADVTARTVSLAASERIAIRCGKASLVLEKDGSLEARGRDVVTRGSRTARLSGGTVRIN